MPVLDNKMMSSIVERFGTELDLAANPGVLAEVMDHVRAERLGAESPAFVAGYSRNYVRGYDKVGYEREYTRYDRTDDLPLPTIEPNKN